MSEQKPLDDVIGQSPHESGGGASFEVYDDTVGAEEALAAARQTIDLLKSENADLKDRLLRTLADIENLRKRADREKAEATLYAATDFARDLLGVADSFSRALAAVPSENRVLANDVTKSLLAGVEVTERELQKVFERHGIRRLDPIGEKFDPYFHQAMFEVPTSDQPTGTVVQVVQSGYAIGERCLRPALVGVAKAPVSAGNEDGLL